MRRRVTATAVTLLFIGLAFPFSLFAQGGFDQGNIDNIGDLRGALRVATSEYADSYVQPVTNAFGAGVNGGLFRSADVGNGLVPGLPIDVYLGLNVSAALTSSMNKRFVPPQRIPVESSSPGEVFLEFVPQGDDDVPTAFGDTEPPDADFDLVVEDQNGNEISRETIGNPPQGLLSENVPATPIPMPQLSVGSVVGTDVQLRYFPTSKISGYGEIGVFGLAVRHDIDQWFPAPLPFNIAVQGAYNQFSLSSEDPNTAAGDFQEVLDASGWAFNLQASKGVPVLPIQFYGGLQYETFGVDYNYTFDVQDFTGTDVDPIDVSLSQDAVNNVRGIVGFSLTFALVRFNVDYAISENNVVTTGLGIRL